MILRPRGHTEPAEVGGCCVKVASETIYVCRLQVEGGKVDKENTLIHVRMVSKPDFFCIF
jgi:hypothetical protein